MVLCRFLVLFNISISLLAVKNLAEPGFGCEKPSDLPNGILIQGNYETNIYDKVKEGETVKYGCNAGFKFIGGVSGELTCVENDGKYVWVPDWIICEPLPTCDNPVVKNGKVANFMTNSNGEAYAGISVEFSCNDGYRVSIGIRSGTIICQENGQWRNTKIECAAIPTCNAPAVENGHITIQKPNMLAGESVKFTCNYGYKLDTNVNSGTIECEEDGHTRTTDTCQAIVCNLKDLMAIPHSQVLDVRKIVEVGGVVKFQCDNGWYPNDAAGWYYHKYIKCTVSEKWQEIVCTAACDDIPQIINGYFTPVILKNSIDKVISGTIVTAFCDFGFKLSNNAESEQLTCEEANSQWKPIVQCKPVCYLNDLQSVPHNNVTPGSTTVDVGESVNFSCMGLRYPNIEDQWWFSKPIKCLASNKWEDKIKCSACDVPTLKDGQLGHISVNTIGKVTADTRVNSFCNYGFEPSNGIETQTLTCNGATSLWKPNITCVSKCKLICQNNGMCVENRLGGLDSCDCPLGFTGKRCETEITRGTYTEELVEVNDQLGVISTLSDMEPYLTAQMNYTLRHGMSVPAEEFIAYCSFAGQSCPPIKYNDFIHMGSCYTINHDPYNETIAKRAGPKQGLHLILFSNETEFIGSSVRIGVKVIIHEQGKPVFPENQGRYLSPGFHFLISIKYVETKRVERKCASEEFLKTIDYFYNAEYTTEGCLKTCYQKKVISACGCGDPSVGIPKDKDISYCSVNERNCVNSIENIKPGECVCPEPCNISTYEQTYSFAKWPAKKYRVPLCEKIVQESIWKDEDLKRCNEAYRKTHLKIDIFYNQLSYLVWTEYPAYTLSNLWSDFGNLFDLFFGVGYIWFFEVAVIVWQVFFITIGIKLIICCQRLFVNDVNPEEIQR